MTLKNKNLQQLRKQSGFTQAELAKMLGYTRQYYAMIEVGKCKMPTGLYEVALSKMYQRSNELTNLLRVYVEGNPVKPIL